MASPRVKCTLSAKPAVLKVGESVVFTILGYEGATAAKIDGKGVTPFGGTVSLVAVTAGKFVAKGEVSSPDGSASCQANYEVKPRNFVEFDKVIKDTSSVSDIDLLWVLDNSTSMDRYFDLVAQNTSQFMQEYVQSGNIKWKMGLISTELSNQPYVGFTPETLLSFQTANPVPVFQNAVLAAKAQGITGWERTFTPMMTWLERYPDFLRPNALLSIIMVTDAVEQSFADDKEFLQFLKSKKGDLSKVYLYGIYGAPDLGCETEEEPWTYQGSEFESIINATKGKRYPLCSPDFGKSLVEINQLIIQNSSSIKEISLPQTPIVNTIEVRHRGLLLSSGQKPNGYWVYDAAKNAVTFHDLDFAPAPHEEVHIKFEVQS